MRLFRVVLLALTVCPLWVLASGEACTHEISQEEAKQVARREMTRILKREGEHEYLVKRIDRGWRIDVDQKPVGPGRHKTIYLSKCGEVQKVEGGR